MKNSVLAVVAAALCAVAAWPSHAQTYPTGAIHLIAPYGPGGMVDVIGRTICQRITEAGPHPCILENKPGGSGIVAVRQLMGAPKDGQTLLLTDIQHVAINPFLYTNLPYDPIRDLAPVSFVGHAPLYLVVQSSLNINSLDELIAAVKAAPGKFAYGSSGNGSIHHISMETIKAKLGLDIIHVPYRGAAPTANGLMTGEIAMMLSAYNNVTPLVESGKGKIIAITTAERSPQEPNVPSVSERIPGYDFSTKLGIVAPAGTPPDIVAMASKQVRDALTHVQTVPRFAAIFKGVDFKVAAGTSEVYATEIKSDYARFSEAVRISGKETQ